MDSAATVPTFDIGNCHCCHERHEGLALKAYQQEHPIWTHWYACPMTGDPVNLRLVNVQGSLHERNNAVLRDIERAFQEASYYVTIVRFDGKRSHRNRHKVEYPREHLDWVQEQERIDIAQQLGALPAPDGPLPKAKRFEMTRIFGDGLEPNGSQPAVIERPAAEEAEFDDDEADGE